MKITAQLLQMNVFGGGAFAVKLQEKDARLAVAAAIEAQVPMPILFAIENAFLGAIGQDKRRHGSMCDCSTRC